jgi:hypothetical protein
MADQGLRRASSRSGAKGALLRDLMLLVGLVAALALILIGWGAWRLDSGHALPEWLSRLAVISGLMSGEQLALAARGADERRTADALSRNEVANRARAVNGVRAAAWDGDRLIVMLAPGLAPTGGRATPQIRCGSGLKRWMARARRSSAGVRQALTEAKTLKVLTRRSRLRRRYCGSIIRRAARC